METFPLTPHCASGYSAGRAFLLLLLLLLMMMMNKMLVILRTAV